MPRWRGTNLRRRFPGLPWPWFSVNVVVGPHWLCSDLQALFPPGEAVYFSQARDLAWLVKDLGLYDTTTEARGAGLGRPVPQGWSELRVSYNHLYLWNPV